MKVEKSVRTYKQAAVNTVILVIILGMFLYLGVQFSQYFSTSVSTQRTQIYTEDQYTSLSGYIFREESVSEYPSRGIIDYLVSDGERVGVNQTYAVFYPTEHLSDNEISEKQAALNDISQRISRLRSGISGSGYVSDLADINETISTAYYSYINAILGGDFTKADKKGETLVGALVDYTVATGREGQAEDIAKKLETEKIDFLNSLGVVGIPLVSQKGFYLFYENDGYENIFRSSLLEGLTAEGLAELIDTKPTDHGSLVSGKISETPKWYLALPCSEAVCVSFQEGSTYTVAFSGANDASVKMNLERISVSENGGAYLLFSSFDLSFSNGFSRMQDVKILMKSTTGYRIPAEALQKVNGADGVYVLIGTTVEFRRVTRILDGNGYYIVNTFEQDRAENELGGAFNSASEVPYLNVNDLIITSGNDLYDGKLID